MNPIEVTEAKKLCPNDLVYTFRPNSAGVNIIYLGVVAVDEEKGFQLVEWYMGEQITETVNNAMKQGKIFIFNREVFIGSSLPTGLEDRASIVTKTRHTIVGLLEKRLEDGTHQKYILPEVPVERLRKLLPFQVGDHIFHKGWIGEVTNVPVRTHWTLDQSKFDTVTATLPVHVVNELGLRLGMKVEKIPEKIFSTNPILKTAWTGLRGPDPDLFRKKPATLTELGTVLLNVRWITETDFEDESESTIMPDITIKADESVELFHFSKDDWAYFRGNEEFKTSWSIKDQDSFLPYEQWEKEMYLRSTGVQVASDDVWSKSKRPKIEEIFNIGDNVIIIPIAVQTEAVVVFPTESGGTVTIHKMNTREIPDVRGEVLPRMTDPLLRRFPFTYMDMVRDKLDSSQKYGFVLAPCAKDGNLIVKWICGDIIITERAAWASECSLNPHDFQNELAPGNERKVAVVSNGKVGTYRGITYPNFKVIVRLVGTFQDEEYWPHQVALREMHYA